MSETEIVGYFSNEDNMYYGHGIGNGGQEKISSIFKNGLRCSHRELYFTTVPLGYGSDHLFKDNKEMMDNWKHQDSKQIIIASIPIKWHLIDAMGMSKGMEHAALYNYFTQEEALKLGIPPGYYLKPEFIAGFYDANDKSFTQNVRYYENLSQEEQKKLFDEVKRQYIDILKGKPWTLEEFAQIMKDLRHIDIPLTPEEIAQADREVFEKNTLESQLQSIAENSREGAFNETTQGIREGDLNPELDEDKDNDFEYSEEGW